MKQQTSEGAVSPVIGVILMVAITVILAATIGTFVLGLGEGVDKNARAGIDAEADDATNNITMSVVTLDNSDYVLIRGAEGLSVYNSPASSVSDGDTVDSSNGRKLFLNRTGTSVKLGGTGSGTVTIVGVIGETPEDGIENGGLTNEEPRGDREQGLTETTIQRVEYDFS
jgi:flagellin-like protein